MKKLPPLSGPRAQSVTPKGLQPGDIILSTTPQKKWSGLIRRVTRSPVSHAMLYVGNGEVVEAVTQGVVVRNLQQALGDANLAVVYRHADMTPGLGLVAASAALEQVGKPYDYKGAGTSWIKDTDSSMFQCGKFSAPDAWFCSELVVTAYQEAGLDLSLYSPACNTPGDILQGLFTDALDYHGHLVTYESSDHDFSSAPDPATMGHGLSHPEMPDHTPGEPANDAFGGPVCEPEQHPSAEPPAEPALLQPFGGYAEPQQPGPEVIHPGAESAQPGPEPTQPGPDVMVTDAPPGTY